MLQRVGISAIGVTPAFGGGGGVCYNQTTSLDPHTIKANAAQALCAAAGLKELTRNQEITRQTMEQLYVTQEGLDKLKSELQECRQQTQKVAEAIEHARSLGDLKENAEYHAAKEQQAMLQARIRDLEDKVSRAVLLDDTEVDTSKAYIGAKVRVLNKNTQKEFEYVLVSPVESDITNGKISVRSPVGQALLGKSAGETVTAEVPAGTMELEILDISR